MKSLISHLLLSLAISSTGCTSMSGYDSSSEFACQAPSGILCESMSGIYANIEAHNLPSQRNNKHDVKIDTVSTESLPNKGVMTKPITSGTPIRSAPRILRLWYAPWEDTDGDLHDQSYVYLPVDTGHWLIEHNRRRILDTYRPVHTPSNTSTSNTLNNSKVKDTVKKPPDSSQPSNVNQSYVNKNQAEKWMKDIVKPEDISQPTK
jgi:conjugal transfer pilus assembly protein TraV